MLISMGANIINAVLNVVFIYICGWGVVGAALASAISYVFSGIGMFVAYRKNPWLWWPWRKFAIDKKILREALVISVPVLATSMVSCLGYVFFAGMVSGMGTTIFAAHSIAVTAETIFYIPISGMRTATSAMVGNALGELNQE